MKDLVREFYPAIRRSPANRGAKASLQKPAKLSGNVVITGLGGSGIGATIASELFAAECPVPITVNKDYFLPGFVNEHTLVVVSSYSGNTEETLQALQVAMDKGAKIVCISSGGKVIELAKKNKFDFIEVPGGMPPRACLAYSLTQLMFVLQANGLIKTDFVAQIHAAIALLDAEEDNHNCRSSYYSGKTKRQNAGYI